MVKPMGQKKTKRFCFMIIFVAAFVVLAGCMQKGDSPVLENSIYDMSDVGSPYEESFDNISFISDDEIKELYQRAFESFAWFDMTTMPVDESDTIEIDGSTFWRVSHDKISTLRELELYLKAIFTDDIVFELFPPDSRYRDIDGVLYVIGGDRPHNSMVGDEVHEIIRLSEVEIVYRLLVDMYDNPWNSDNNPVVEVVVHDFHLVYTDGAWRFSNFHMVR